MKRYDLVMHMSVRELAGFIGDIADNHCEEDMGPCSMYSRCAGCYTTWLNREVGVHWCTNCRHYEKWGKCVNKGCEEYNSIKDYDDSCDAWEPADWWTEPEVEKTCWTCGHHDDHIGKCLCGDSEIIPPAEDDEPPCPAWEPRKEKETWKS